MADRLGLVTRPVVMMFCCLTLFAPAAAAQETGAVTGTITGPRGEPARLTVIVRHLESGVERSASSQADGTFVVGRVPIGRNLIVIENQGFAAFSQEVTVTAGQPTAVEIRLRYTTPDFSPVTDRWRLRFPLWERYPADPDGEYPFVRNRGVDPYDQNVLKGDLPVIGDSTFLILTGVLEMPFEFRRVPTPSNVSTSRPGSEAFFGRFQQYAVLPTGIGSVELFHGSTAFRPRDWAIRVTPQFNFNYVHTEENSIIDVTPEEGPTRARHHLALLQEAFGEVKLFDVGANYDFVSVRGGIQPFNSDFRGFLFRDTNFGVRAFGTWGRNRNQWNVAWFDQLEKETNSELNLLERRHQRVFIANYYRQDFLTDGYTVSPSFHANMDHDEEFFFDENGFLVRPAPVGLIEPHEVNAYYVGFGGDGHIGRLNVTHQFYQAFGEDGFNGTSGQPVDINAQFVALELSVDRDWLRPRASFIFASGDADPDDDSARGFDAIVDNPNIAGGPFSFWSRQVVRLAQTGVELVGRNSVLPALRSSKSEGQASFVNPGVIIVNGGLDAQVTPRMRITGNASYLQFHHTEVLKRLLFQSQVEKPIGIDASVGVQYRPALNDNLLITGGISFLLPGRGFKQILTDRPLATMFVVMTATY